MIRKNLFEQVKKNKKKRGLNPLFFKSILLEISKAEQEEAP